MADSGVRRKMTVTACSPIYNGTGKTGKPYTIYEVFAVDEGGQPIDAKLRAFDLLALNELVEYEVTRRDDRQHGTSYTLKKPGKPDPPPDPKLMQRTIREQGDEITALTRRLDAAEAKVREVLEYLRSGVQSEGAAPPDVGDLGSTAPPSAALASDSDIRF